MASCAADTVYRTDDNMDVLLDSVPIPVTDFNIDELSRRKRYLTRSILGSKKLLQRSINQVHLI